MTHIVYTYYAVYIRTKMFVQIIHRTVHNILDLNRVDYSIYALQQSMSRTLISSMDDLKDRVRCCWKSLDQTIIDESIDHWRDKLKAVIRLNGGYSEQLF